MFIVELEFRLQTFFCSLESDGSVRLTSPPSRCKEFRFCLMYTPTAIPNYGSIVGARFCVGVAEYVSCWKVAAEREEIAVHHIETWSRHICSDSWICMTHLPVVWSVVSSASMWSSAAFDGTCKGRSLIYRQKSTGPKTDPCGTPYLTTTSEEYEPWTKTRCILLSRYEWKKGSES